MKFHKLLGFRSVLFSTFCESKQQIFLSPLNKLSLLSGIKHFIKPFRRLFFPLIKYFYVTELIILEFVKENVDFRDICRMMRREFSFPSFRTVQRRNQAKRSRRNFILRDNDAVICEF